MLVTGGAGGIGSAICRLLPTIGLRPIIGFNRNKIEAYKLADELHGLALHLDMSSDVSIANAIENLSKNLGDENSLAGVILGASLPPDVLPFSRLTSEHLSSQFRVSVVGPHILLAGLIKKFFQKSKTGMVVGIVSEAIGTNTEPPATGMGSYVIAKSAFDCMLSVCAVEYPWLKVERVNPGFTRTKMLNVFDPRYLELIELQKSFSSSEEIARLVIKEIKL